MNKKENEKDYLTGLYNYQYLIDNYQTIIQEKDNYYLIVIDFKNFKYINDNFGHEVGDKGLVVFSEAAKKVFKNDFVIRRSGDEFIVVTKQPISKINQKIDNIHDSINQAVLKKIIPIPFGFNSGLTKAEKDLEQALLKAEVAMYQAKSKRVRLVIFKDIYLKKLKEQEVYLNQIDEMLLNNQFDLKTQELYDLNHQKQNIFLIFVKDEKGRSVFKNKYYELLKNSFRIRKIEMQTLNIIYSSKLIKKEKTIINLDYQTLFGYQFDFANYVTKLAKKNSVNPSKVIFCININNYEGKTEELLKVLNKMKKRGFN